MLAKAFDSSFDPRAEAYHRSRVDFSQDQALLALAARLGVAWHLNYIY